ncbi:hypothetical protein P43SY_001783 [Pythium insidiosum]|uniref:EF-hand domain-containing protein n=1 Tax=Pythium insidiosum TaxID=114742 RepID=A0AAD5LZA9_PYTIN|nr:hypothetical protein P43SY_001783 [Pythium insidiosum]
MTTRGTKLYAGKIIKAHSDGTFDVRYDDGDVETHVDGSDCEMDEAASADLMEAIGFECVPTSSDGSIFVLRDPNDAKSPVGKTAADYYRRKALAAELAKDEASSNYKKLSDGNASAGGVVWLAELYTGRVLGGIDESAILDFCVWHLLAQALFPVHLHDDERLQRPVFTPTFTPQEDPFPPSDSNPSSHELCMVLYLMDDGRVLEFAVDVFKPEHLDIGNPSLMNEQWLEIEEDRLEPKVSALKDILLQPERVLRPDDDHVLAQARQQFTAYALSRRTEGEKGNPDIDAGYHSAWTFISARLVVEFLLQQGNLAVRMEKSLDLVLEALLALEICVDQSDRQMYKLQHLSTNDVIVSPDCLDLRVAALDVTKEEVDDDDTRIDARRRRNLQWHTRLFGRFIVDLLTQFEAELTPICDGMAGARLDDVESARRERRLVLGIIERHASERLLLALRSCLKPDEIARQQDADADPSTLTLFKLALMACLPTATRPRLTTLWALLFGPSRETTTPIDEGALASQSRAFAALTTLQESLETDVLTPLSVVARAFSRQTSMSALGSLLELFCGALSRFTTVTRRLVQADDEMTASPASVVLHELGLTRVWARITAAALSFFTRFVSCGQRDGAQHVVNAVMNTIRSVLQVVDVSAQSTSAPATWRQQQQALENLEDGAVSALISIASGQMPEHADVPFTPISTAQQCVLWRLCEPVMQELLASDNSVLRLWRSRRDCLRDLIPIQQQSELHVWWSDRDYENPPRRDAVVMPRPRALSLRYLTELRDSLELRFSIAGGAAIPARYRLASLQGCFANSRLGRRQAERCVISHGMNARVWSELQIEKTIAALLEDTDDRIVHAALSVLDVYTRVLRSDFQRHLLATEALELAHRFCSPEVLSTVRRLLVRVVRQLRLLGESGVDATRAAAYGASLTAQLTYSSATARSKSPIAILCVALSYLVNTLHGGDRCTQHWVTSGVLALVMGFARSNVLSFLRVLDANLLLDISPSSSSAAPRSSRRSTQERSSPRNEWSVFTQDETQRTRRRSSSCSSNESPFRLLLRELMTQESAPLNLTLLRHIRESKRSVQFLLDIAPHEAFTAQLLLSSDVGQLGHAAAVLADVDECQGTLGEKTRSLHYARATVCQWLSGRRRRRARDPLPSSLFLICRRAWHWLSQAIVAFVESDAARQRAVIVAALHVLHDVVVSTKLTAAEVRALCQRESGLTEADDGGESPTERHACVFQSVLELAVMDGSGDHSQSTADVHALLVEFLCAALQPTAPHCRLVLVSLAGVSPTVDVLRSSRLPPSDKLSIWCALLEICDRDIAIAIVDSGFLEFVVATCSHQPSTSSKVTRLEALLYLEALHHAMELLDSTTGATILRLELVKCVLHCSVIRSQWRAASGSAAEAAIARRVLQIICSTCVNPSTGHADPAVLADLEAVGITSPVIQWHQARGSDRLLAEADSVRKRVTQFWLTLPFALRDCGISSLPENFAAAEHSSLPFSELLHQYARHSGLEAAWTGRSQEREWRWVLLPSNEWVTISPTNVEALQRKLSSGTSERRSKSESLGSSAEDSDSAKPMRRQSRAGAKDVDKHRRIDARAKPKRPLRVVGSAAAAAAEPKPERRVRDHAREALQRVFRQYDVDGDGVITFIDLRRALDQRGSRRLSNVELQRWLAEKDSQGAGAVDFNDFARAFGSAVTNNAPSDTSGPFRPARDESRQGRDVDYYS